jgi:hypothetical protein
MKRNKKVMDVYFQTSEAYVPREEILNDDAYLVVPVVMMMEGVHSGSKGPVLHTTEELGKIEESWDGMPVTIGHPQVDGEYVSANSPSVLTEWSTGTVFNTHMDGSKLRAEAWINKDDIEGMNPDLYQRILDKEIIEVSVGVFSEDLDTTGIYEGEPYVGIATNYRPDHLALLPDEVGACSIEKGCGIRVNKAIMKKDVFILNSGNKKDVFKELNKQGLSVFETGMKELADKAREAVWGKDNGSKSYYLDEIYSDYLVYRENDWGVSPSTTKLFKQSYQENAAGEVELTGEAVQVKRTVSYDVVPTVNSQKRKRTKFSSNNKKEGGSEMPKNCQKCKDKATALINNTATKFTDDHRDFLENMELSQLELLEPTVVEKEVQGVVTNAQIMTAFQESVKTPEDFLKFVPDGMKDQFTAGLEMQTNAKAKMITSIMANTEKGVWTKEELEDMSTKSVTKVYKSITIDEEDEVIYAGESDLTAHSKGDDGVEIMAPIGVNFKKKED